MPFIVHWTSNFSAPVALYLYTLLYRSKVLKSSEMTQAPTPFSWLLLPPLLLLILPPPRFFHSSHFHSSSYSSHSSHHRSRCSHLKLPLLLPLLPFIHPSHSSDLQHFHILYPSKFRLPSSPSSLYLCSFISPIPRLPKSFQVW